MPVPATVAEFVELGCKGGVLEATAAQAYCARLQEAGNAPTTAVQMAQAMVRDGLLTVFQAERLLAGKWRGFILSGKYRLLECIGSGGMGSVFLSEHLILRRRVAIKVLTPHQKHDSEAIRRFIREARATAMLAHPNIVRAHDVDQDVENQIYYLVMEHIEGRDLHNLVKEQGRLTPLQAASYVYQAALGLQHAHEAQIVHRDIKPGNLLVDRSGVLKILDMGLARFFNDDLDPLTVQMDSSVVLGTADYLSPEQAVNSHTVDIRSDIYSLGGTFYYLLTGLPPFPDGTTAQKLLWHQVRTLTPVTEYRADVPAELLAILSKMMAKSPEGRFQQPIEVAQALQPWCQHIRPQMPEHSHGYHSQEGPSEATPLPALHGTLLAQQSGMQLTPLPLAPGQTPAPVQSFSLRDTDADTELPTQHGPADELFLPAAAAAQALVEVKGPRRVPRTWRRTLLHSALATAATLVLAALIYAILLGVNGNPVDRQSTSALVDKTTLPRKQEDKEPPRPHADRDPEIYVGRYRAYELRQPVFATVLAPDRQSIFAAGADTDIQILDVRAGANAEPKRLVGHTREVQGLDLSRDGKLLVSGSGDGSLRLWQLADSKQIVRAQAHEGKEVDCVAFLADASQVLSAGRDHKLRLWDAAQLELKRTYRAHSKKIACLAVAPGGQHFVSGDDEGVLRLWHVDQEQEARQWALPKGPVRAVCFAPDGRQLCVGGQEGEALVWDVDDLAREPRRLAHPRAITSLLYSPDGRYLFSACEDLVVYCWDVVRGQLVYRIADNTQLISSLSRSADGRWLVVGSRDASVRLWALPHFLTSPSADTTTIAKTERTPTAVAISTKDNSIAVSDGLMVHLLSLRSGVPPKLLRGHTAPVTALYFSNLDALLFSGDQNGLLQQWDVFIGRNIPPTEPIHEGWLRSMAISPNGTYLATAGDDSKVRIWTGPKLTTFKHALAGHALAILSMAWLADGNRLATLSVDRTLRIWNAETAELLEKHDLGADPPVAMQMLPNGTAALVAYQTGHMQLLPLGKMAAPPRRLVGARSISCMALTRDGRYALTGGSDGKLCLWDVERARFLTILGAHAGPIAAVDIAADSDFAVTCAADRTVRGWKLPLFTSLHRLREVQKYADPKIRGEALAVTPDGKYVLSGESDRVVRLRNLQNGNVVRSYQGHQGAVRAAQVSADGRLLITGGDDQLLGMWHVDKEQPLRWLRGHEASVMALAISADGRYALTGSADKTMRLWDLGTGRQVRTYTGHTQPVTGVAFTPDGAQVVSASLDRTLGVWERETGQRVRTLTGHADGVTCLALSPDGSQLLSGDSSKKLILWSLKSGQRETLEGHIGAIRHIAFAPDGKWAMSVGEDKAACLWDVAQRRFDYAVQVAHTDIITGAAFLPNGRYALTGGNDGTMRMWELPIAIPAQLLGTNPPR